MDRLDDETELRKEVAALRLRVAELEASREAAKETDALRLRQASALARLGTWEWEPSTDRVTWFGDMFRIYGIRPEEFTGKGSDYIRATRADYRAIQQLNLEAAWKNGVSEDAFRAGKGAIGEFKELCIVRPDGTECYTLGDAVSIVDADGKPLRMLGITVDVTERKKVQQALCRTEDDLGRMNRELRAIRECLHLAMRAQREQQLLDNVCQVVCEKAGYRMAWVGFAEHDEAKSIRPVAWAGAENGYLASANLTWADDDRGRGPGGLSVRSGESQCIQDFATDAKAAPWREKALQFGYRSSLSLPLKDEKGCTFGILAIYSAETNAFIPSEVRLLEDLAVDLVFGIMNLRARIERDRAESALRESEERFAAAFHASPNLIAITALDGTMLDVNEGYSRLLGYSREESLGKTTHGFAIWGDADDRATFMRSLQKDGQVTDFETSLRRKDGSLVTVLDSARTIMIRGEPCILSVAHDISERKRAESALRESEARFNTAFQFMPVGAGITTLGEGRFVAINKYFCDFLGYSEGELLGHAASEFGIWANSKDRAYVISMVQEGKPIHAFECQIRRKDGSLGWVSYSGDLVVMDGVRHLLSGAIDITERKRAEAEKAKLEAQLLQAQKMESVGRLAGGVAHDFNNMLGVILGHVEMAMDETDPAKASLHGNLEEIRKAAERSANLTRQLLGFARKQTAAPKVLDLNETVASMLKMLRRLVGENMKLVWLPGAELFEVRVDPSQVDQILANLCVNARDAIEGVGKLTIETANSIFDDDHSTTLAEIVPGEYVKIAVTDDGCGMDKATQERIFEPFFTTKGVGKGTGLGLATVYGIVKQNNGFINVTSELSKGTTFDIYLPRHLALSAGPAHAEPLGAPVARGRETILVVEDEPAILDMTKTMLERLGYTVLSANTPGEAIRLAGAYAGMIHLLITDVVMPEMNGRDLAKRLLTSFPALKRLFMSGHTADVIARHGMLDEEVQFIQKPFSKKDLAALVRQVLECG